MREPAFHNSWKTWKIHGRSFHEYFPHNHAENWGIWGTHGNRERFSQGCYRVQVFSMIP